MHFLGYDGEAPVNQFWNLTGWYDPMPDMAMCGDPKIRITPEMQEARARHVTSMHKRLTM